MPTFRTIKRQFDQITNEVSRLVEDKSFFLQFQQYISESDTIPPANEFLYFIRLNYIENTVIGIYKQLDRNRRAQSLLKILEYILNNSTSFTIERFSVKYTRVGLGVRQAQQDFSRFAIADGSRVSKKIIKADIVAIRRATRQIVRYRNQFVAHRDRRRQAVRAQIRDIYTAVDLLESLAIKYNLLLNQGGMETLLPTNSNPDLAGLFK